MLENMPPAMGYVRLSDRDKGSTALSPDLQRRSIRNYCEMKGWRLVRVFEDIGVSGGRPLGKRKGGGELVAELLAGPCPVVCVCQDRLFRDSADAIVTIRDWISRGILPVFIAGGLDLTTPTGRLSFGLMSCMNQYEREVTGERTRAIMKDKKARGEQRNKYPPFGFRFEPSGKVRTDGTPIMNEVADPKERSIIHRMKVARNNGRSLADIAEQLDRDGVKPRRGDRWAATSVRKVLNDWAGKNPLKIDAAVTVRGHDVKEYFDDVANGRESE